MKIGLAWHVMSPRTAHFCWYENELNGLDDDDDDDDDVDVDVDTRESSRVESRVPDQSRAE